MEHLLSKNCSRDEFFLLYLKLVQERLPDCKMEMIGESSFRVVRPDGKEATAFMDNAWLSYSRYEENRKELLDRYARVSATMFEPAPAPSLDRIVAMIKDSNYVSSYKPDEGIIQHLCADLWVVYAEDLPDRIVTLKKEVLTRDELSEVGLQKLACDNLRRILPEAERHGEGPWYMLTAGGDYTASLLLFEGLWDGLADSVEGDIVAVVPSRDVLLYTGSQSPEGLDAIRKRAADILATGNYLISGTLIVRLGEKWEVFNAN